MAAFSRPRPSGIIAITLEPDDMLINVERTSGHHEIVLGSRNGMAIRFHESRVRAMGRMARGVRGMNLARDDYAVSMVAIEPGESLLTVCENGFGKRTSIDEYRKISRGGKGVINIKTTQRNGKVVSILAVNDQDELMMITANGILLRTDLTAVREIGRATQGIRLIRLSERDKVVAVAKIAPEDENGNTDGDSEQSDNAQAVTDTTPDTQDGSNGRGDEEKRI